LNRRVNRKVRPPGVEKLQQRRTSSLAVSEVDKDIPGLSLHFFPFPPLYRHLANLVAGACIVVWAIANFSSSRAIA
jgi:hypothetical protein